MVCLSGNRNSKTEETLLGVAEGWHRCFCLHLEGYRGTPEQPGLMLALDQGGRCEGVLQRLPENAVEV